MTRKLASPAAFYTAIRNSVFAGKMSQAQVAGCNVLLTACGDAGWKTAWTAYGLATAFHETNATMEPVREAYWLSEAWRKANLYYWPYYGRGYVQLTWMANYQRADDDLKLGGKLMGNLDLAMQPDIAARIMIAGMAEGWFAKDSQGPHSLSRHLPTEQGTVAQFLESRRIINGLDKTAKIAGEARDFQAALTAGKWT